MHYRTSGQGKPFIFQHGLSSQLQQAQQLLSGLEGIQLISMDCPGHGQAPLPDGQTPSFRYYANQVLQLMDDLDLEDAIIGGISMGSGIALELAQRWPQRVKALVLVRPAWLDKKNPPSLGILAEAADYIGQPQGKEKFKKRADFQAIYQKLPQAAESILGVFAPTQRPELPLVLGSLIGDRPFTSRDQLKEIQQPTLLIGNQDDPLHPFQMAKVIQEHLPNCQLEKVTSRYLDNNQHQKDVFQLVSKFITTI